MDSKAFEDENLVDERPERRLAAILAADVAGYSRLMGVDEEGTLASLKAHRRGLLEPKIKEHRGHIVKTTGDGMLVEFASAVDAVRCAVEIQRGMVERNVQVEPTKRIELRMGINVGDIIKDGDDIFGNGVNVAARLEAIADNGGICISRQALDQVEDKVQLSIRRRGLKDLKNIAKPIEVYSIDLERQVGAADVDAKTIDLKKSQVADRPGWLPRKTWLAMLTLLIGVAAVWWSTKYGLMPTLGTRQVTALSLEREQQLRPADTFEECDKCPEVVVIPSGKFLMGSNKFDIESGFAAANEKPQHEVAIAQPFAVGRTEVTRDQFDAFVRVSGYKFGDRCYTFENSVPQERDNRSFRNPGFTQTGAHPAVCINWTDARAYVEWLSRLTGKPYRLLSESEWEYVARAGSAQHYGFGNDAADLCRFANGADRSAKTAKLPADYAYMDCTDGFPFTAPAGSFHANAWGLFDTLGNAWEWVEDCYADDYTAAPRDGTRRETADCESRTVRGGSWYSNAVSLRPAVRAKASPSERHDDVGFRIARTLAQ